LEKIFWSILPLLIITLLGVLIFRDQHDFTSFIFGGIFLFGAALPVISAFCNAARIAMMKKRVSQGRFCDLSEIKRLEAKFSKYVKTFMLTWTAGAITAGIIGISIVFFSKHLTQYPQPANLSPGSDTYTLLQVLQGTEFIAKILTVLSLPCIGVLILFSLFTKRHNVKKLRKSVIAAIIIFVLSTILLFLVEFIGARTIRREVRNYLQSATDKAQIFIDGKAVNNPAQILMVIRKLTPYAAHHSHAENRFELHIVDSDQNLTLQLGRDSQISHEYWIYYPSYDRNGIEIGRITTNIFDK
jgi:hypothetical protein